MALRKLDVAILALCAVAIILSMHQEGDLSLEPSWYFEVDSSLFHNGHGPDVSEILPQPLVTDLDGDGTNEIIIATRDPGLKVLHMSPDAPMPRTSSEWDELEEQHEVSLLAGVGIKKGRQAVALASGYLEPYDQKISRKQVIIVVTEGWNVLCFNSELQLLWERTVEVDMSESFLGEVSILVTWHRMKVGDVGTVIVGGRLHARGTPMTYNIHRLTERASEPAHIDFPEPVDPSNPPPPETHKPAGEQDEERLGAGEKEHMGVVSHFSFYAFEGKTGANRWKHEAQDFHQEVEAENIMRPQHEGHQGEVDWRNFRYSVMAALPHQWKSREDTVFHLAHIEKRRSGKDRQRHMRVRLEGAIPSTHVTPDLPFGGLKPFAPSERVQQPNAIIAHLRDGIEVIHLFSGRTLCRVALKRGAVHVDVNGDGVVDHVEAITGGRDIWSRGRSHAGPSPRCLGLVTSGIPATQQLYNGSICSQKGLLANQLLGPKVVLEGDTDQELVIVAHPTVVKSYDIHTTSSSGLGLAASSVMNRLRKETVSLDEGLRRKGRGASASGNVHENLNRQYHSVYLVNSGLVTGFGPDGQRLFSTQSAASWSHDEEDSSNGVDVNERAVKKLSFLATISPYRLRPYAPKDHVVAIGEEALVVLSSQGTVRASQPLEDMAVAPPVLADFNNDGWTDVIVPTTSGFYGFILERRVGYKLFTVLVGCVLILLAVIFILSIADDAKRRKKTGATGTFGSSASGSSARLSTFSTTGAYALRHQKDAKAQS